MDDKNLTKYERRQLEKADREKKLQGDKTKRKIRRYTLWITVLVLIFGTVWQVNRLVPDNTKSLPLTSDTRSALSLNEGDWFYGATTSPVVLIEYSDFQCPACAEYNELIKLLKKDYPKQLTVVFRHYPWFFHQQAMNAALAAEAAGAQGQFWAMHDGLFAKQKEWSGTLGQEIFIGYAKDLGLDVSAFRLAMADKNLRQKIEGELEVGKSLGIDYTPAFAINGKIINNPRSYEEFRKIIDQALKN